MYAGFKFDFPTVTGPYSVTGLGFRPQGVVLIGTNQATKGSLITGRPGPGLGMGISALDYATKTSPVSLALAGNGKGGSNVIAERGLTGPITMSTDATTASTIDYKASSITFDADGFTLDVTVAASGVRPIFGFAWGTDPDPLTDEEPFVTSTVRQIMNGLSAISFPDSFSARSALVLATVAGAGFVEGVVNGELWFSFGGGFYPPGATVKEWSSSTIYCNAQASSPLGQQGFTYRYSWNDYSSGSQYNISNVIDYIGPLLVEGFRRHRPSSLESLTTIDEGGAPARDNYQLATWWNDAGVCNYITIPAFSSVTIEPPSYIGVWKLMLFAHINGEASGNSWRYGLGLLTETMQSCCVQGFDGSFYQSDAAVGAYCSAAGAKVVTGTMEGKTVTLTNTSDQTQTWVYHGWGTQTKGWLPVMYRWWSSGKRLAMRT